MYSGWGFWLSLFGWVELIIITLYSTFLNKVTKCFTKPMAKWTKVKGIQFNSILSAKSYYMSLILSWGCVWCWSLRMDPEMHLCPNHLNPWNPFRNQWFVPAEECMSIHVFTVSLQSPQEFKALRTRTRGCVIMVPETGLNDTSHVNINGQRDVLRLWYSNQMWFYWPENENKNKVTRVYNSSKIHCKSM